MRIDCYGEKTEKATFEKKALRQPLETKFSGEFTYMRFGEGERVPIHRLTVGADGIVRREWARGKWEEAENLAYVPATQTMEVDG